MLLYVQWKGVLCVNLKERVETPRRGWVDNIKTVPNGICCEGKAWFT